MRALISLFFLFVYFALAFGLRGWLHYRTTGSTGLRGLSGRAGSLGWLGGLLFFLALPTALLAPILEARGIDPLLVSPCLPSDLFALGAMGVGLVGTLWAQSSMGASWRVGLDERERTALVASGPFRWVRNPIFTSTGLAAVGLCALLPTRTSLTALITLLVGTVLQVRFAEEPYLRCQHGEAYARYCRSVGRFLPGIGCAG